MAARERRIGYFALAVLIIGVVFFTSPGGQFSITAGDCELEQIPSPDGNGFQTYQEFRQAADVDASDEELSENLVFVGDTLHQEICGGAQLG